MTNHYLRNAVPDHIAGVISACEGIQNNLVLLNGPIGCKTYYTFSGVDSLIRRSNLWTLGDELRLEDLAPIKKPPKFHLLTFLVLMHMRNSRKAV